MFTITVISFCWWNLVLNISLKRLEGLGCNFIFRLYLGNTLCQQSLKKIDYHLKKKLYHLYFRAFLSLSSMFTFIVINFCWWNLVLNISLKILDALGWNLIFRLYLGNNLCQQTLEKMTVIWKKLYYICFCAFFSFPSMFTFIVLIESCAQHIFKNIHLKNSYIIYIFAPSCPSLQCLHSLW